MRRLSVVVIAGLVMALAPVVALIAPPLVAEAATTNCAGLQAALDASNSGDVVTLTETCNNMSFRLPPRPVNCEDCSLAGTGRACGRRRRRRELSASRPMSRSAGAP